MKLLDFFKRKRKGIGIINKNFNITESNFPYFVVIDNFFVNFNDVLGESLLALAKDTHLTSFNSVVADALQEEKIVDFFNCFLVDVIIKTCEIKKTDSGSGDTHPIHNDKEFCDYIGVVYLNTRDNGGTDLFVPTRNGFELLTAVKEVSNRILIFDSSINHRETSFYDNRVVKRYTLNIKRS